MFSTVPIYVSFYEAFTACPLFSLLNVVSVLVVVFVYILVSGGAIT